MRRSTLLRNTGWMLAGNGLRIVIQAGYFILLARSLGPQNYGAFAAAIALVGIIGPFVGLGCGNLLVKNVARDRASFPTAWGNGLFLTLVTGMLGIALVSASAKVIAGSIPITLLIVVSMSDLVFFKLIQLCSYAFGSFEMMGKCTQVNALVSTARLIGIALLAKVVAHPTVTAWGGAYLCTTAVATVISLLMVRRDLGGYVLNLRLLVKQLKEGLYFATSLSATSIYNDIDKTMLAHFGTLGATGIYAAAYRLIDVTFVPVSSLMAAAYPRFFRKGADSVGATIGFAKQLLGWSLIYAATAFALLMVCAPVVPRVLGAGFAGSVEALRWLALLPVLKAGHYLFADALSGAGLQGVRTLLQIVVAVFNVVINLWLIPAFSWRGAAWSSLLSDGLLALLMWAAAILYSRRGREPGEELTTPVTSTEASEVGGSVC